MAPGLPAALPRPQLAPEPSAPGETGRPAPPGWSPRRQNGSSGRFPGAAPPRPWRSLPSSDYKTILVNRAYKAETNEVGLPKWGRTRTTIITAKVVLALQKLRKARQVNLVFCDTHGRPHGYHWWAGSIQREHTVRAKARTSQPSNDSQHDSS